jgi:hypothetical protein
MVDIKAIRVVPFSGKQEDWNRWSKTFLATITAKGFKKVLKPDDPTVDADADHNTQVYGDLILSCQEDIVFGIVDGAVSTGFEDGDARLAWTRLCEKFEPKTGATKVQLKKEFNSCKLQSVDEDPDEWITKLEHIKSRLAALKVTIENEDLMLHILNNLSSEYDNTVEICEEELTVGTLTLDKLKERLRAKFVRI